MSKILQRIKNPLVQQAKAEVFYMYLTNQIDLETCNNFIKST